MAKEYLSAKARARASRSRDALEMDVYNHLYAFFNRYYHDGDFISKRRYSRKHRYAIPYNGEEVYLHWANSDQYYIKTDEHFHNYQWKSPIGVIVHFQVVAADVEQSNVKGERRFFVPKWADAKWESESPDACCSFQLSSAHRQGASGLRATQPTRRDYRGFSGSVSKTHQGSGCPSRSDQRAQPQR